MAERRSTLKNNQNTLNPRFIFTPKTGSMTSLKQMLRFYSVNDADECLYSALLFVFKIGLSIAN